MIADIMRSEKFKAIVKELFIRCRKLNISIVFIAQSYPFKRQSRKMVKHTQTNRRQFADDLFECV